MSNSIHWLPLAVAVSGFLIWNKWRMNNLNELPRGIRNNNPLNIRLSSDNWRGMDSNQDDGAFVTFTDPVYGIRAATKIIRNYGILHGVYSLQDVISRWAPAHENPTNHYVHFVSERIGIMPADLVTAELMPDLLAAMIEFENGYQPYSMDTITTGVMAGFS